MLFAIAALLTKHSCVKKLSIRQLLNSQFSHLAALTSTYDYTDFPCRDHFRQKCAANISNHSHSCTSQMPEIVMNMDGKELNP